MSWSWEKYWSDKTDGQHRYQNDEFIKYEVREVLYHLNGGNSLLDFGCGSGQLLVKLSPEFERVTGVDFSQSMLDNAQKNIENLMIENIRLIRADDKSMWEKIDNNYDRIMNWGVVQYLSEDQIDYFVKKSSEILNPDGKIIFFSVIDPRLFDLWKAGFFSDNYNSILFLIRVLKIKFVNIFKRPPKDILGYAYPAFMFQYLGQKYGFQTEFAKSMYYEYRYHVILSKLE